MKVICISGHAGNGKDHTASCMYDELTNQGCNTLITHYADLVKYVCKSMFGWNGEKDAEGRHLLQYVGTDVVRAQEPDYWVDFIISILKLFKDEWDYVLIPDTRFPNEINKLKEEGFDAIHVRVIRPDYDNGLSEEAKAHISETALDNIPCDYLLVNPGNNSYTNKVLEVLKDIEIR